MTQLTVTLVVLQCLLLLLAVSSFRFNIFQSKHWIKTVQQHRGLAATNIFSDIEDEEELVSFKRIVSNYLGAKFRDCRGEDCKFSRDRSEVKELMRVVLPPVSKEELDKEVKLVIGKMGKEGEVLEDDYVAAVLQNSYWSEAGAFVVKELIFLDCLQNFYANKDVNNYLSNEDYDELKEQLSWEGSVASSLSSKEAQFISAVAAGRRGVCIMGDGEYNALKQELATAESWVVKREMDPLEKMGVSTFMSYLHRSFDE